MTFQQITDDLLTKPNSALYLKKMQGVVFIEDLHRYVKEDLRIIAGIKNPRTDLRACLIKEQLLYIYENWNNIEKHTLGWKPKKKR